MLRIRDDQLEILRADRIARSLVPAILGRLREAEILPAEEEAHDSDDDDDEPAAPDGEAQTPEERAAAVHADILEAMDHGITSEDGILQYVSYRFLLDPGWRDLPGARDALAQPGLSEEERLAAVHRVVSGG